MQNFNTTMIGQPSPTKGKNSVGQMANPRSEKEELPSTIDGPAPQRAGLTKNKNDADTSGSKNSTQASSGPLVQRTKLGATSTSLPTQGNVFGSESSIGIADVSDAILPKHARLEKEPTQSFSETFEELVQSSEAVVPARQTKDIVNKASASAEYHLVGKTKSTAEKSVSHLLDSSGISLPNSTKNIDKGVAFVPGQEALAGSTPLTLENNTTVKEASFGVQQATQSSKVSEALVDVMPIRKDGADSVHTTENAVRSAEPSQKTAIPTSTNTFVADASPLKPNSRDATVAVETQENNDINRAAQTAEPSQKPAISPLSNTLFNDANSTQLDPGSVKHEDSIPEKHFVRLEAPTSSVPSQKPTTSPQSNTLFTDANSTQLDLSSVKHEDSHKEKRTVSSAVQTNSGPSESAMRMEFLNAASMPDLKTRQPVENAAKSAAAEANTMTAVDHEKSENVRREPQTQQTTPLSAAPQNMDPDVQDRNSDVKQKVQPDQDSPTQENSTSSEEDKKTAQHHEPKHVDAPILRKALPPTSTAFGFLEATPQSVSNADLNSSIEELVSNTGSIEGKAVDAASAMSHAARVEIPTRMAMQIADVARVLPDKPVEITLSPEELGKVRLSFQVSENGAMQVVIAAERGETMDLLRRNIDTLAAEFKSLGYEGSQFSFEGFDQGGSNDGEQGQDEGHNQGGLSSETVSAPAPVEAVQLNLANATGIDIRL